MKKPFKLSVSLLALCALLMLQFSCTRTNSPVEENQDAELVVKVSGLEDYVLDETAIELSSRVNSATQRTFTGNSASLGERINKIDDAGKAHEIYVSDDFDIDFEYEQIHPKAALPRDSTAKSSKKEASMSTRGAKMARQPIGTNVKYRLLIYRQGQTTPVVNVVGDGLSFPATAIASGFAYRWIAVSTNETASAPTVTNNVVSAAQIANKDFLFASGTFTSQFGQNFLNIIFNRYTSRVMLTVDARGMFGRIADGSNISFTIASGGNLSETADFSVLDSTFSNYQASVMSSTAMTAVVADNSVRVGALYTVRPRAVTAGNLSLRLNPLSLTLDNGNTRTFTDQTVSFGSAFAPVRGSSYNITARLIESGVRVGTSATRWARSNLTYNASEPEGFRYRFRPHPTNTFDANVDLWNYLAITPLGNTFSDAVLNPCRQVYPSQTWRLPTPAEWQALPLPNSLERYVPLLLGGVGLVANWNRSTTQPANSAYAEMDQLRLPFYGYRTTTGGRAEAPRFLLVGIGGQGHYYSNTYNRNTPLTDPVQPNTVRPQFFRMNYSGLDLLGLLNLADGYSQLFVTNSSSPNNSSTAWNEGRSIRCVRNL